MPRKRFNAFDDFPNSSSSTPPEWENEAENQPAAPVEPANSLFTAPKVLSQPSEAQVERIERLKPSQMMPDRFQPRRLLPTTLRQPFYSGQIDCYQTARQWLQMARSDSGMQAQVERLMKMGLSFEEHGQIKPITGSWMEGGDGQFFFQIETGERRFWAACLQFASHALKEEPLLRVEVVTAPTRMRQVLENRHAEPPSAVGQACEVASLILAELGMPPEGSEDDEFDYFRQARTQRMPPGLWDKIMPVMDLTRPRLVQLLNILMLPTPLLELADRYRLPERVLREVMTAPSHQWDSLIRTSIQKSLTSDDVAQLTAELGVRAHAQGKGEKHASAPTDPVQQAINALKRFSSAMNQLDEDAQNAVLDELANDFILSEQSDELLIRLRELSERIRIRLQSRMRRR